MAGKSKGRDQPPNFQQQAEMSSRSTRPNWSGPTGGQTWSYDPYTHMPTMNFSTPFQGTFDALKGSTEKAASMDPSQAFNQAVNTNLGWGMSRLEPMFNQQNQSFNSQMANSGIAPGMEAFGNANTQLGNKQADMFGTMFKDALNAGNETQRTQIAQSMAPFQQLGALTNSVYAHPYMGQGADYLGSAKSQYTASERENAQADAKKGSSVGAFAKALTGGMGGAF